ncbi:MAG: autotransporter, partial [Castellaniella sp.]
MWEKFALCIGGLALSVPWGAQAYESYALNRADGTPVFEIRFFASTDAPFWSDDPGPPMVSTWALSAEQKANILNAGRYWASVIRPVPSGGAGVINIGTYDDEGAFGDSISMGNGVESKSPLQIVLQGSPVSTSGLPFDTHGVFAMGKLPWTTDALPPSQIGLSKDVDMTTVAVHELAHTLGAFNSKRYPGAPDAPFFSAALNTWAEHLVDDNGNPARAGQAILCAGCSNVPDPAAFDVRKDQGMFVGAHVLDALEGGLAGLPVKMMFEDVWGNTRFDNNAMSHIELKNSMMSHQNYRNYTRFMEAELGLMQDLGYGIDRRDFFGRSIYGSGLDIVNTRGYFARNADGTAYLDGQYNLTETGLGLHVYGSNNRIRQAADLLTAGAGGAGVRVDGEANVLTIDPGVRVHALGLNGQGILFAYGKGHQLVVRGDVRATGELGVGLRFDFGHNLGGNGDVDEYRGSYIRTSDAGAVPMLDELKGALVDHVNITGTVVGSAAALYISENALVGQINVMQGAQLQGDIVSLYDQKDEHGDQRLTTLSFGQRADATGRATGQADADFRFSYTGNIVGDNLVLSFDGGRTSLNCCNQIHSAVIRPGALLSGNAAYELAAGAEFLNEGMLAPGNSIGDIGITGDYRQTATGTLQAEFDAAGDFDLLMVDGTATLAGTLDLQPLAGWYANGWSGTMVPLRAVTQNGDFDRVISSRVSPTLSFTPVALGADPLGDGEYRVDMNRPADAYSRYGAGANDLSVGQALTQLAAFGTPAVQPLFRSLDFSAPDGHEVTQALAQLSPAAYSAGLAASLRRDRAAADAALHSLA